MLHPFQLGGHSEAVSPAGKRDVAAGVKWYAQTSWHGILAGTLMTTNALCGELGEQEVLAWSPCQARALRTPANPR